MRTVPGGFNRVRGAFSRSSRLYSTNSGSGSKPQDKEAEPQPQPQEKQPKKSVKQIDDEMLSKLKERDPGQEEIEEGNIGGGLKHHRYENDERWNDLESSLSNIHAQSLLINQESSEQNGLLDSLSSFIDTINNKMSSGKKYFDKLSVTNDKQSICIAVLIVILVILFIVLIVI